jgi:hypothetical protein
MELVTSVLQTVSASIIRVDAISILVAQDFIASDLT